jgi:glutaredoxin
VLEIVVYSRTTSCPFVTLAKRVFADYALPYREIYIDKDMEARQRVLDWTGFLAVPTIIVAWTGDATPISEPDYLERGQSPRGIDRGHMITEPNIEELKNWLMKHGFVTEATME